MNLIWRISVVRERYCRVRFLVLVRFRGISTGSSSSVLHYDYSKSHFKGYTSAKKRIDFLLGVVKSCFKSDLSNCSALSIGPRYESELYGLRGLGFHKRNIVALDTFSYSPMIKVGNVHKLKFQSGSFDLVLCGWTIAYSEKPLDALEEMIRVLKPMGKLVLTWDLLRPVNYSDLNSLALDTKIHIDNSDNILSSYKLIELFFRLPVTVYRLEVGKLSFNSETEFITVILEKSMNGKKPCAL
jgi:SAM-dependent methyltransferase